MAINWRPSCSPMSYTVQMFGMIQGGGCLGFAAESFECLRVLRYLVWQEFQCDEAVEAYVFGFVDHTHSTAAEFSTIR